MDKKTWLHLGLWTGTASLALTAVGGVGFAAPQAIPGSGNKVSLCYNEDAAEDNNGGAGLRIYDAKKNDKKCAKGDEKLTINAKGKKGSKGDTGPSVIPMSGVTPTAAIVAGTTGYPEGVTSFSAVAAEELFTAAVPLTLSTFSVVLFTGADAITTFTLGSGLNVITCTIPVAALTCTPAATPASIAIPAGGTYTLTAVTAVAAGDTPVRFSYVQSAS